MTLSLAGSDIALGSSIAIPAHQAGDLILIFAYNDGASTAVVKPSTVWISRTLLSIGASGSLLVAYQIAPNSSVVSGNWTNADGIMVMVLRPDPAESVAVNYISSTTATSTLNTYSAQAAGTFETDAPDQAFIGFIANRNAASTLIAPTGMTNVRYINNGSTFSMAGHIQLSRTSLWASQTVTEAISAANRTVVLNVTSIPKYGSSTTILTKPPLINQYIG